MTQKIAAAAAAVVLGVFFLVVGSAAKDSSGDIFRTVGIIAIVFGLEYIFLGQILAKRINSSVYRADSNVVIDPTKEYPIKVNPQPLVLEAAVTFPLLAVYIGMFAVGLVVFVTNRQLLPYDNAAVYGLGLVLLVLVFNVGLRFFYLIGVAIKLFQSARVAFVISSSGIRVLPSILDAVGSYEREMLDDTEYLAIPWANIQKIEIDPGNSQGLFGSAAKLRIYRHGAPDISLHRAFIAGDETLIIDAGKVFAPGKVLN